MNTMHARRFYCKRKGPSGNFGTEIGIDMLHKHAKMYLDSYSEARCIKSVHNCPTVYFLLTKSICMSLIFKYK